MNVPLNTLSPLPSALSQPRVNGVGRRHLIGDYDINRDALRHFNDLLEYLDLHQTPLDCDQVASAARELVDRNREGVAPRCIQQRIRRGAAVDLMLKDPDWETVAAAATRAVLLVDYLRGSGTLIPHAMPVVGRLDDAIVVEAAWPSLAEEVRQYLAFCRIRHVEATLRGETHRHFGFTREQGQAAARAEAGWIAHCQRVGHDSYLRSGAPAGFRVH